ncbi:MAG: glycosyltransferase family 1 protein [Bacteroidales bacterium]
MSDRHIHIISFAIPYPANYGGVIDVFYKLRALHSAGIKIHLHCFSYERESASELLKYCEDVFYYPRRTGLSSAFTFKPYIVASRRSTELLRRLLQDNYPILFEGLHSCYYLDHPSLKGRILIYRESNIEHAYYYHLAIAEKNLFSRAYFLFASLKLRLFQRILKHATQMLVVSEQDCNYLKQRFPYSKVTYLPSFHANEIVSSLTGQGEYALYHGNLSVPENNKAAEFLVKNVFETNIYPLIIAGLNPSKSLIKLVKDKNNIRMVLNPGEEEMDVLVQNAHVNVLVSFQATGLKLKLLNTLYKGRFVLVNRPMLNGTGLNKLCTIADDAAGFKVELQGLFSRTFEQEEIYKREKILGSRFSNRINTNKLIHAIFESC